MKIHLYTAIFIMLVACKGSKELSGVNDKGCSYKLRCYKTAEKDSAVLIGNVDLLTRPGDPDNFVKAVKIDGAVHHTDADGNYKIRVAEGTYQVTGIAMPYNPMTVQSLRVRSGDSIVLNFKITPNIGPIDD